MNFEKLLAQFEQAADALQEKTADMLTTLSEGKVPSEEKVADFDASVSSLREEYNDIVAAANEMLTEEERISEGSAVKEFAEAVKKSAASRYMREAELAKETISRFLRVKSLVEVYSVALQPYQEEARKSLYALGQTGEKKEKSTIDAEGPAAFLKALDCADFDSDEGLALLEDLGAYFSHRVQFGLQGGKYFVGEADVMSATDSAPVSAEPPTVPTETAASVWAEEDSNRVDTETTISPLHSVSTDKTVSAAKFKESARGLARLYREIKFIFPLLTNLGVLTARRFLECCACFELTQDGEISADRLQIVLEDLTAKGYLACYLVPESEERAYCLTPYAYGCLRKNDVRNHMPGFWMLSFGESAFRADNRMSATKLVKAVAANEKLIAYIGGIRKNFDSEVYTQIKQSIAFAEDAMYVAIPYERKDGSLVRAGVYCGAIPPETSDLLFIEELPPKDIQFEGRIYLYKDGDVLEYEEGESPKAAPDTLEASPKEEEEGNGSAAEAPMQESAEKSAADTFEMPPKEEAEEENVSETEAPIQESVADTFETSPKEEAAEKSLREVAEALSASDPRQNKTEYIGFIHRLLCEKRYEAAIIFAYALQTVAHDAYGGVYDGLSHALGLYPDGRIYSYADIRKIYENDESEDAIWGKACALVRRAFQPTEEEIYDLRVDIKNLTEYPQIADDREKKEVIRILLEVIEDERGRKGFSTRALGALVDKEAQEKELEKLAEEAGALLTKKIQINQGEIFVDFFAEIVGQRSEVYKAMCIIRQGEAAKRDEVEKICNLFVNEEYSEEEAIKEYIQAKWKEWKNKKGTYRNKKDDFKSNLLMRGVNEIKRRLSIMERWLDLTGEADESVVEFLRVRKAKLEKAIRVSVKDMTDMTVSSALWGKLSEDLTTLLGGETPLAAYKSEFLRSHWVELDPAEGEPIVDESGFVGFTLWERVLRHVIDAQEEVLSSEAFCECDDYGFARCLESDAVFESEQDAKNDDDMQRQKVSSECDMAYMYGRIDEEFKESAMIAIAEKLEKVRQRGNYGLCAKAYEILREQIKEKTEDAKRKLVARYEKIAEGKNAEEWPILQDIEIALHKDFPALAEEYLHRAESGVRALKKEESSVDYLKDFLKKERRLLRNCKEFEDKAYKHIAEYKTRDGDLRGFLCLDGEEASRFTAGNIRTAREQMGYFSQLFNEHSKVKDFVRFFNLTPTGNDVERKTIKGERVEYPVYKVKTHPTARNRNRYEHPIAKFGTRMGYISIVCIDGKKPASVIASTIANNLGKIEESTIVLLNSALEEKERQALAVAMRTQVNSTYTVLVVDRVLFAYLLSRNGNAERLKALLMCTLPYTNCNPYQLSGEGEIADEMFFGRREKLENVTAMGSHSNIVCGGRQLGKTAMLMRAKSMCHNPDNDEYAYYVDAKVLKKGMVGSGKVFSSGDIIKKLLEEMSEDRLIEKKAGDKAYDWHEAEKICRECNKRGRRLLWFIDEADCFLESEKAAGYPILEMLRNLQEQSAGKFKYVIAGLRNVSRQSHAHNERTWGETVVIPQFTPAEARELVEIPLRYLGYRFEDEQLLAVIMAHTNYYPSNLQYFCARIVDVLGKNNKSAPPYVITEELLGKVFEKAQGLDQFVKQRFKMTLTVDPDNQYEKLALALCLLYQEEGADAYTLDAIMHTCQQWDVPEFGYDEGGVPYTKKQLEDLFGEMVDLGVFTQTGTPSEKKYRFRKHVFFQYVSEHVEEKAVTPNTSLLELTQERLMEPLKKGEI